MELTDSDMARMLFLESLSDGNGMADGCDTHSLAAKGLIEMIKTVWTITPVGQAHLAELQSAHASLE